MSIVRANRWELVDGIPTGTVLQTLGTENTTPIVVSASASWYDVCTISITPSAATNKILLRWHLTGVAGPSYDRSEFTLRRDTTLIHIGDPAITSTGATGKINYWSTSDSTIADYGGHYLDAPNTTSTITYRLSVRDSNVDNTIYINRSTRAPGTGDTNSTASALVIQEIQG